MALYMLGTDVALRMLRGRTAALDDRVAATRSGELCISAVTRGELLCGVRQAGRSEEPELQPLAVRMPSWLDATQIESLRRGTHEFLTGLTPAQLKVLRKRFGVRLDVPPTLEEVTRQFEATRDQIRDRSAERLSLLIDQFLSRLTCLPWDEAAATQFAAVTSQLESAGVSTHVMDRMIVGHTLAAGTVLVTAQTEAFASVRGLRAEDWTKSH